MDQAQSDDDTRVEPFLEPLDWDDYSTIFLTPLKREQAPAQYAEQISPFKKASGQSAEQISPLEQVPYRPAEQTQNIDDGTSSSSSSSYSILSSSSYSILSSSSSSPSSSYAPGPAPASSSSLSTSCAPGPAPAHASSSSSSCAPGPAHASSSSSSISCAPGPSPTTSPAPESLSSKTENFTSSSPTPLEKLRILLETSNDASHAPAHVGVQDAYIEMLHGMPTDIVSSSWKIWHKVHLLVSRYGFVSMDEIEDLLLSHFEIQFKPQSQGFSSWRAYWNHLNGYFSLENYKFPRCAVIKEVFSQIPGDFTPTHVYLVAPDSNILDAFDKLLDRSFKKHLPIDASINVTRTIVVPESDSHEFVKLGDTPQFFSDFIKKGCLLRCITVCVKSFDEFYLQIFEELGTFFEFELYIKSVFDGCAFKDKNFVPYHQLTKGLYVAVHTNRQDDKTSDVKWFRGRVLKVCDNDRVLVHLVDYGNWALVDLTSMRRLPKPLLMQQPVMAVRCQFECVNESDVEYNVKENCAELGLLLRDCLVNAKAQELVKFCYRFVCPVTKGNPWKIKSTLVHPILQEFFTPNRITSEMILDMYFKHGARAEDVSEDLDAELEANENVQDLSYSRDNVERPVLESWKMECFRLVDNKKAAKQDQKPGIYCGMLKNRQEVTFEWMRTFSSLDMEDEGNDLHNRETNSRWLVKTPVLERVSPEEENDFVDPDRVEDAIKVLQEYTNKMRSGSSGVVKKPRYFY